MFDLFNRKANRIADLEARNAHLLRELAKARERPSKGDDRAIIRGLRTQLHDARETLRLSEDQLGLSRRGALERADLLEEARDALEAAGCAAHEDDWPRLRPAIDALVRDRDHERAMHEEHRRGMALVLDLPADTDWLAVTRRITEIQRNRAGQVTAP